MPPGFTRSCLGGLCSLVWAGFPVAPEGVNAVLGQLARWFYPFGSGAHCNNYYYYMTFCCSLLFPVRPAHPFRYLQQAWPNVAPQDW